ncbi:MAG: hypothetical protein AB8H79_10735 [Myxococcota bacterium]
MFGPSTHLRWIASAVLFGCAAPEPPVDPCAQDPTGLVAVPVSSPRHTPRGGEGRLGDGWLADPMTRAVIRRPAAGALTDSELSGGTLVDLGGWAGPDLAREVIALVDGAPLRATSMTATPNGWVVSGVDGDGEAAEFTWTLDGQWLVAEGADALWVRPLGGFTVFDEYVDLGDHALLLPDGHQQVGSELITMGDRIGASSIQEVSTALWKDQVRITGSAVGAEHLDVYAEDRWIARLPITDDAVDHWVPEHADALIARFDSEASQPTPIGANIELVLGPAGFVELDLISDVALPRVAQWSGPNGPGSQRIPATGGVVPTGPGRITLSVAGQERTVDVSANGTALVSVDLRTPHPLQPVNLRAPGERSATWTGTDAQALDRSSDAGHVWSVLVGDRDIATGVSSAGVEQAHTTGVRATSADGAELIAWPYTQSVRRSGHGAPPIANLSTTDAIAALSTRGRNVLAQLDDLSDPDAMPTHVELKHPGQSDDLAEWSNWFSRLSSSVPPAPIGPQTWLAGGATEGLAAEAEVERGTLIAGNGPLLTLSIGEVIGGETRRIDTSGIVRFDGLTADIELLHVGDADELLLIADGRVVFSQAISGPGRFRATIDGSPGWVLAVLRGPEDWATTAAVQRRATD